MPLFHKKPFQLLPVPKDIKPEEEVFVCKATQEIFRDYESFFNRTFLCSTHAWTCSLTGMSGLTYVQAMESEKEARKMVDSLANCYKQASLELIHHAPRTNMKTLADEICLFYRDRFVVGEVVDMTVITSSGAKIVKTVKIVRVILPASPSPPRAPSPIKVPVITTSDGQQIRFTSPQPKVKSPVLKSPNEKLTNGLSPPPMTNGEENGGLKSPQAGGAKSISDPRLKSPQPATSSKVPISSNVKFEPSHYRYFVEEVQNPEEKHTMKPLFLSRSKGVFTPKKLRVFLRCSTYRNSEKQPFIVKDEFVKKYNLGQSSIDFAAFMVTPKVGRKRSLSQAKLSVVTPNGVTTGSALSAGGSLTSTGKKKGRPSLGAKKSIKTPVKRIKKRSSVSSKKSTPTSAKKTKKVKPKKERKLSKGAGTPKSPPLISASHSLSSSVGVPTLPPLTPSKSPRSKMEALKVLNKAKRYKQLDLKKNVVKKKDFTPEQLAALKELKERERLRKFEEERKKREEEKKRKEEERKRREEEKRERKEEERKEREEERKRMREEREKKRLRELEWLKPREDLTCEDSRPLPSVSVVNTTLPQSLFGDAVMVVEFLRAFGPLFNLKEVISSEITFEMIEYAICSQEMDSQLFEIVKFLLQAIFATMEEEHEDNMVKVRKDKKSVSFNDSAENWKDSSSPVSSDKDGRNSSQSPTGEQQTGWRKEDDDMEQEVAEAKEDVVQQEGGAEKSEEKEGIQVEGDDTDEEEDEEVKPMDVRLEAIKAAAVNHSQWSVITQNMALHKMVIDAYTITEVLRLHFLSCGGYRESPDRRSNRVGRRGGFLDADDPAMELMLNRPEICSELLFKPVFSLSSQHKVAVLSALCMQLLTYAMTREFVEESYLETRKAAIDANKIRVSEVRRKKEEEKALTKWKKERRLMQKQKETEKKQETSATEKTSSGNGAEDATESSAGGNGSKTPGSRTEVSAEAAPEDAAAGSQEEDMALGGPPPVMTKEEEDGPPPVMTKEEEDGPPPVMTKEEEEAHLEKVEEEMAQFRKASYKASASVRTQPIGEDRYRRKYWLFHTVPGLFVEDRGIHQIITGELNTSYTDVGSSSAQIAKVDNGVPSLSQSVNADPVSVSLPAVSTVASASSSHVVSTSSVNSCLSAITDSSMSTVAVSTEAITSAAVISSELSVAVSSSASSTVVSSASEVARQQVLGDVSNTPLLPSTASPVVPVVSPQKLEVPSMVVDSPASGSASDNDSGRTVSDPVVSSSSPPSEAVPAPLYSGCVSSTKAVASTSDCKTAEAAPSFGPTWHFYSTKEEVESLVASLNPRGLRESKLRKNLLEHLRDEHLSTSKHIFQGERSLPNLVPKYNSTEEFFELYLREQILDIEEKIHLGNLGYISNREEWRGSIENSGAAAAIGKEDEESRLNEAQPSDGDEVAEVRSPVRELANALLQVQDGIGKKFLMPPLGMAMDQKKKRDKAVEVKETDICVESWRKSLSKASSFSQIFLHLATLERAVMWSKSLMKVRCRICRRKCGEEFMLLCDGCDHGYHTYCLKPPLEEVPEGDWFCYDCVPVTPIKPRLRRPKVVIVEEEVEEEEEEEMEEEEEEEEDDDEAEAEDSVLEETESDIEEESDQDPEEEYERVPTRKGSRQKTPPLMRGKTRAASKKKKKNKKGGRKKFVPPKAGKRKRRFEEEEELEEEAVSPPPPKKKRRGKEHDVQIKSGKKAKVVAGKKQTTSKSQKRSGDSGKQKEVQMRSRKRLRMNSPVASIDSPVSSSNSKTEQIIASIIDLRTSQNGQRLTGSARRELRGLESQLCQALWDEISVHKDSWHFATPVKKRAYPDYFEVIPFPMDLSTVKSRIKRGGYSSIDEFLCDMFLIFSNAAKYKKLHPNAKKAGGILRKCFEKRCNELGLKDLQLSVMDWTSGKGKVSLGTRQSSRLRR